MSIVNKRRAGDENIGKLIVFAVTIVIAIGLVGLVTYFYNQSRETAINTSILADTGSTPQAIKDVLDKFFNSSCTGTGAEISNNPISGVYTLGGTANCDLQHPDKEIKGIIATGTGTYTIK